MEKWKTAVSTRHGGEFYIRGRKLSDLIQTKSFVATIFLLWRGSFPNRREAELFNAMLVSAAEHGVEAPSTFVSRTVASTGNTLSSALAAGILAMGEWHGGAIEKAAYLLQSKDSARKIVADAMRAKARLPGFGHRIYKDEDPRTALLFKKAKKLGLHGKLSRKAQKLRAELKKRGGKTLPLNIDGALAALFLELGFDWRLAGGLFILARVAGIAAHCFEEMVNEKPYRRLEEEDTEYIGPKPR